MIDCVSLILRHETESKALADACRASRNTKRLTFSLDDDDYDKDDDDSDDDNATSDSPSNKRNVQRFLRACDKKRRAVI